MSFGCGVSWITRFTLDESEWTITFHSHSFPPQIYTWTNISEIVEYASVRGIKVVPEMDVPAHVGEGWQYFNEDILLCFKDKFCRQPPCGILNPVNDRVYEIVRNLYSELFQLFDTDVLHVGGDEIVYECWNKTSSILKWLTDRLVLCKHPHSVSDVVNRNYTHVLTRITPHEIFNKYINTFALPHTLSD